MRLYVIAVALLLALAAACGGDGGAPASSPSPTQTPAPTPSPRRSAQPSLGKVAFAREGHLWLKDLNLGQETALVQSGVAHSPKFSYDGAYIAYGRDPIEGGAGADLFVLSSEHGGKPHVVGGPAAYWGWSPTRPLLAYQLATDGSVWEYDALTGEKKQLLAPHQRRTGLVWSPDGRFIAYGVADFSPADASVPNSSSVNVYDLETGDEGQVVIAQDGSVPVVHSWSPEGSNIIYWSTNVSDSINADGAELRWAALKGDSKGSLGLALIYREAIASKQTGESYLLAFSDGGWREIWVGKDLRITRPYTPFPIQPFDTVVAAPGFSEIEPSWQPDGDKLAFVRIPEPDGSAASAEDVLEGARIRTVRDDGTSEVQLTHDAEYSDRLPAFSADGSHILFLRLRPTDIDSEGFAAGQLWVMGADGSDKRTLVNLGRVPWLGYYGRIDEGLIFDWYSPAP